MSTLYAPVGDEVYEDLRAVARLANLSIAKTADAMLCNALGRGNTFGEHVAKAVKVWKDTKK